MTFRLAAVDVAILDALRDKFGLRSRADALRYAMRRTAEAEGVDVTQQKAKPKRRKAALPHKGQRPGGEIPGRLSLVHHTITSSSTEEHHDVYRISAGRSRDRARGPHSPRVPPSNRGPHRVLDGGQVMARPKLSPEERILTRVRSLGHRLALEGLAAGPTEEGRLASFYGDMLMQIAVMGREKAPDETVVFGPGRTGTKGMFVAVVSTAPARPEPRLRLIPGGRR